MNEKSFNVSLNTEELSGNYRTMGFLNKPIRQKYRQTTAVDPAWPRPFHTRRLGLAGAGVLWRKTAVAPARRKQTPAGVNVHTMSSSLLQRQDQELADAGSRWWRRRTWRPSDDPSGSRSRRSTCSIASSPTDKAGDTSEQRSLDIGTGRLTRKNLSTKAQRLVTTRTTLQRPETAHISVYSTHLDFGGFSKEWEALGCPSPSDYKI